MFKAESTSRRLLIADRGISSGAMLAMTNVDSDSNSDKCMAVVVAEGAAFD